MGGHHGGGYDAGRPRPDKGEHGGEPGACPLVKLMLVPSSITTGSPLVYVPTNTCGSALLHTVTDPHSRCCELAYLIY